MDRCGAGWLSLPPPDPLAGLTAAPVRANSHFGTQLENNSEISIEVLDCKQHSREGEHVFPYLALTLSVPFRGIPLPGQVGQARTQSTG